MHDDQSSHRRRFLPDAKHFEAHPDSAAARVRRETLERIGRDLARLAKEPPEDEGPGWLDLTADSTEEEIDAACRQLDQERAAGPPAADFAVKRPPTISTCPLDPSWPQWDMFGAARSNVLSDADARVCREARSVRPADHLALVSLEWETAGDSGDEHRKHLHADAVVESRVVHLDWVTNTRGGPGRTVTEFRVFVDGRLAGRGGRWGCSLGAGGGDLPLVARIGPERALTLDQIAGVAPVVELWRVT